MPKTEEERVVREAGHDPMITIWKRVLLERAAEWNLPEDERWRFLFHNNYQPHSSSINLLWFHDREKFPRVVTKIYREPKILKREFESLVQARGDLSDIVPRPLHFGVEGKFWTLWMEGVPGLRLRAFDKHRPVVLRTLTEAVLAMHLASRKHQSTFGSDRYGHLVSEPLRTVSLFGSSAAVREGCAKVAAEISSDWINSLLIVPQHGDLFFGNVLLHHQHWYIVDWETYGKVDLPLYDLLTLFLSLILAQGPIPERWSPELIGQMPGLINAYSRGLGLHPADIRLLFPLTLVNWFHIQWEDGRQEFTSALYRTIDQYFQSRDLWENRILSPTCR